jgi:hypothetical protein
MESRKIPGAGGPGDGRKILERDEIIPEGRISTNRMTSPTEFNIKTATPTEHQSKGGEHWIFFPYFLDRD